MLRVHLILAFLALSITSFTQESDAELIYQKTTIVVNKGILTKEIYHEIRINNRAGEKYTRITIPYSKLNKLKSLEAYIKDSNGKTVKKLAKSEIITSSYISDYSFYEDDFKKEFTLKHNSYPYTIVYSYLIQQSEFLYIDYWIPVIDEKVPTLTSDLLVNVPLDYRVSYKNEHIADHKIDTVANRILYKWSTGYTKPIKAEAYSPPIADLLPSVAIVPLNFSFEEEGSYENWVSYGNWQFRLLKDLNELPDTDKRKILELIKNMTDDKEKIRALYHYLQDETRYINVTIETGGLKPYPAVYVAQNKYGDCKALTNYFKSILDFINIPSYYAKVNAGSPVKEIDKRFPSQQFNHAILYIPQKDNDIWLDCTSEGAFNYLGSFTQNRDALIVDNDLSTFKRTPALQPKDVLVTRKVEIKYHPEGALVTFLGNYRGEHYENLLHLQRDFNESERSRIVRNNVVNEGFQLIEYQLSDVNRDSAFIELYYKATSQNLYKNYGDHMLLKNISFSIPDFEKPKNRKLPVQIDFPIYAIDTLIYEIPAGYVSDKSHDNYNVHNKYGEFSFNVYENKDNIMVIKCLLVNSGIYPTSEYEDFYDFYEQVVETENKTHLSLHKIN